MPRNPISLPGSMTNEKCILTPFANCGQVLRDEMRDDHLTWTASFTGEPRERRRMSLHAAPTQVVVVECGLIAEIPARSRHEGDPRDVKAVGLERINTPVGRNTVPTHFVE